MSRILSAMQISTKLTRTMTIAKHNNTRNQEINKYYELSFQVKLSLFHFKTPII